MSFIQGYSKTSSFQSQHGSDKINQLTEHEALKKMEDEKPKIVAYRSLSDKVLNGNRDQIFNEEYWQLVCKLLEVNHELYTVWNYRKDLIQKYKCLEKNEDEIHSFINTELAFIFNKLRKNPKSYWIWNHRIWCLKFDRNSNFDNELKLINQFLAIDSRNYHVWSYRRVIIDLIKKRGDVAYEITDFEEFKFTMKMINKDISNYSAWHNRSKLIEKLFIKSPTQTESDVDPILNEYLNAFNKSNKLKFLHEELKLFKKAIYTDAEDSSIWFYMKWLCSDYFLNDLTKDETERLLLGIIDDIKELNELETEDNGVDNKWCLISLIYLMKQLERYHVKCDLAEFDQLKGKLEHIDYMRVERYKDFKITS